MTPYLLLSFVTEATEILKSYKILEILTTCVTEWLCRTGFPLTVYTGYVL